MKTITNLLAVCMPLMVASFSIYAEARGAKVLFSDKDVTLSSFGNDNDIPASKIPIPRKPPNIEKQYMGISYWIELERNGKLSKVSISHPFVSGDKIQLRLKTNRDGYLYVTHQGSTGALKKLFPLHTQDVLVKAGTPISIPDYRMMHFDNNSGEEKLWMTLSAVPLNFTPVSPQVTSGIYQQSAYQSEGQTVAYTGCGSKDLLLDGGEGDMNQVRQQCGSKDLVVEEDTNASYVVAPVNSLLQSAPIIVPVTLKHN